MDNTSKRAVIEELIADEQQEIERLQAAILDHKRILDMLVIRRDGAASAPTAQNGSTLGRKRRMFEVKHGGKARRSVGLADAVASALSALGKPVPASEIVKHMESEGFTFGGNTPKDVLVRAVLRRGVEAGKYAFDKDPDSKRVLWSATGKK